LKRLLKEAKTMVDKRVYDPDFTSYELDDMDTDHQMIALLSDILSQLKVLNYHTTPAKGLPTSGAEKAVAGMSVAEEKKRGKKR